VDLRAQELGSATKDSDGKRPALYGSCRRAIRPARYTKAVGAQYDRRAIRKLSAVFTQQVRLSRFSQKKGGRSVRAEECGGI